MFEFVTLRIADRYMRLDNSRKRIKLMRLEGIQRILDKLFKWGIIVSIFFGLSWNIGTFRDGRILLGILDVIIEYIFYPVALLLLSRQIRQNKFEFIFVLAPLLFVMMLHTPTYSPMLIWCLVFVPVRFQLSGLMSLSGYPKFQDDLKGRKADVALTEEQRYAAFVRDVKQSNKIRWHDEQEKHESDEILSGQLDLDGYLGVHKAYDPGVMDELIIPDDLELGDLDDTKNN